MDRHISIEPKRYFLSQEEDADEVEDEEGGAGEGHEEVDKILVEKNE